VEVSAFSNFRPLNPPVANLLFSLEPIDLRKEPVEVEIGFTALNRHAMILALSRVTGRMKTVVTFEMCGDA
jgi:hypothetical protein